MTQIRKVYIASPLFNPKEREENEDIDLVLKKAGFETFLPQRDGFLFVDVIEKLKDFGCDHKEAERICFNLIAHLDIYQVCECCDATVLNLNGRVPDEGSVSEAAMTFRGGRPLVIYKQDLRSLAVGKDNPLIVGLTGFEIVENIEEIPNKLKSLAIQNESAYSKIITTAKDLFSKYHPNKDISEIARKAKEIFS